MARNSVRITNVRPKAGRALDDSSVRRVSPRSLYLRENHSPFMFGWNVPLREPRDETMSAWVSATAKAIDTLQNSGWLAGGTVAAKSYMIGAGLALNLRPELNILGNAETTETWAREFEARWEAYANDAYSCDLGGRYTMAQLAGQAVDQWFRSGEAIALVPWRERVGSSHGTKIKLIPSSRLSQASTAPDVVQGVRMDADGAPIGYLFEDPTQPTQPFQQEVAARDEFGRPMVLHMMDAEPGAVRGITPLAPALRVIRQLDQLHDATLTAAVIQAVFAATIESGSPPADIMKALQSQDEQADRDDSGETTRPGDFESYMDERFDWYKTSNIDLGRFGKIIHTFPGETMKFHRSEHPNSTYDALTKSLLREVARCVGVTYAQLTGDFIGETYSSLRMEIADMWILNLYRRAVIPGRVYQSAMEAFMEEEIITGSTPFPPGEFATPIENWRFLRRRVCRADWRGPPRPTADDLKTAKAQQLQRQEGWVPTEQIAAEYGNDHRDVIDSQERTNTLREEAGLAPLSAQGLAGGMGRDGQNPGGGGFGGTDTTDSGDDGGGGDPEARVWRDRAVALAARANEDKLVAAMIEGDDGEVARLLGEGGLMNGA